jgi:hypothetical protein
VKGAQWIVAPDRGFGIARLAAGTFDIDLDKRIENRVKPLDARKMGFDQFNRRKLLVANFFRQNGGRKIVEIRHVGLNDESSSLSLFSEKAGEPFACDPDALGMGAVCYPGWKRPPKQTTPNVPGARPF